MGIQFIKRHPVKKYEKHVSFYNSQVNELREKLAINSNIDVNNFKDNSPDKIGWSSSLVDNLRRLNNPQYEKGRICEAMYRPFFKQYLYTGDKMIHRRGQFEQLFPNNDQNNYLICVSCLGTNKGLSVMISKNIPDLHFAGDTQCFPLYWYEKKEKVQGSLFEKTEDEYICHDAISDFILEQAKTRYDPKVTKEDVFYYVYGILHSPDYRNIFANDLKKMLPRLPLVEKVADFWAFSKSGRSLAAIHLNYEEQEPPKEVLINGKSIPKKQFPDGQLTINKMSFPSKGKKGATIYNSSLTISNIPEKAYDYIENGKSAIEWVMGRYGVTTHKESSITNDPNDWAREHGNPQYILDLLLSAITVSMKTVEIVEGLPKVEWGGLYE